MVLCPRQLLFLFFAATFSLAATADEAVLVDRIVAVVDEQPIFSSDVERVVDLGLAAPRPGESDRNLRRRVLDGLIEEHLRLHAADRFGAATAVPAEVIDHQVEAILASRPASAAVLSADERARLRRMVARQLRVLRYVEERLSPRVFVDLDAIGVYYESELVPAMEARGETAPPLAEVREEIRTVLRERRLNEEIVRWTAELRQAADVIDYFDRPDTSLPPIVQRLDG